MITRTVTIVSQHINREFYLLLGKFELLFLISIVQDGKSTDQQEYARIA